jgi:hypothetical protein
LLKWALEAAEEEEQQKQKTEAIFLTIQWSIILFTDLLFGGIKEATSSQVFCFINISVFCYSVPAFLFFFVP